MYAALALTAGSGNIVPVRSASRSRRGLASVGAALAKADDGSDRGHWAVHSVRDDDTTSVGETLVAEARNGDVTAFERLLRIHDDRMRALAYRMLGSPTAMDDALQDAYIRAFRGISGFRGDSAFSTWLHRIVATTCIDHLRRQGRRREDEMPDDLAAPATGGTADPVGDQVTRRGDLAQALDELPSDQRAALILVDAEGLSYEEAAATLGVAPGTVSSRLTRARATMRTKLNVPMPRPRSERDHGEEEQR